LLLFKGLVSLTGISLALLERFSWLGLVPGFTFSKSSLCKFLYVKLLVRLIKKLNGGG
jgi:hypothetical protein